MTSNIADDMETEPYVYYGSVGGVGITTLGVIHEIVAF